MSYLVFYRLRRGFELGVRTGVCLASLLSATFRLGHIVFGMAAPCTFRRFRVGGMPVASPLSELLLLRHSKSMEAPSHVAQTRRRDRSLIFSRGLTLPPSTID